MPSKVVESNTVLSESIIWNLNQTFYKDHGIDAWRKNEVPSHITSNSMVGKTYAEMLFGILMDFRHEKHNQRMYFLEMGAGHGKLAFYILTHLERILEKNTVKLPEYTYILSDISEKNLDFFSHNDQLKTFINRGLLDLSYFNALSQEPIYLRHSKKNIIPNYLKYPLVGIGNYFLDSIPADLYKVDKGIIYQARTHVLLDESTSEENMLIDDLNFNFKYAPISLETLKSKGFQYLLEYYKRHLTQGFFFLPTTGILCMEYLESCSQSGLIMLVMDKGFHKLEQLENNREPEIIQHGSTSIWVNFHALAKHTETKSGRSLLPSHSHVHINVVVYAWLHKTNNLENLITCYKRSVDDFGPNEINSLMKFSYAHIASISLTEIIANLRMNQYDPHYFNTVLPRLKQLCSDISKDDRDELYAVIPLIYELYFYLGETADFTYELGGLMFDMAYYKEAVSYFQKSLINHGPKPDVYFNMALCFYQLRLDEAFLSVKAIANIDFPEDEILKKLDDLDLSAE